MRETTARWIIFGALCIGAPIYLFAFVIAAIVPISGLPAVFLSDPDSSTGILCLVHIAIYAGVFFLLAKLLAKGIYRLHTDIRWLLVAAISIILVSLPLFPIYGYCMVGCDQMTLFQFYQRSLAAA